VIACVCLLYTGGSTNLLYKGNYTVKPVYKGHSREPTNVLYMSRLKLYAPFINGEMRLPFVAVICCIEVAFKADLTVPCNLKIIHYTGK
jgi:hypothetical protein